MEKEKRRVILSNDYWPDRIDQWDQPPRTRHQHRPCLGPTTNPVAFSRTRSSSNQIELRNAKWSYSDRPETPISSLGAESNIEPTQIQTREKGTRSRRFQVWRRRRQRSVRLRKWERRREAVGLAETQQMNHKQLSVVSLGFKFIYLILIFFFFFWILGLKGRLWRHVRVMCYARFFSLLSHLKLPLGIFGSSNVDSS